jgi:hypothetical protein
MSLRKHETDAVSWSTSLDGLIADASAPAHESELVGLAAALTAFSTVPAAPRRRRALSRAATVAALTTGSLMVGGVALAAANGSLPAPVQTFAHHAVGAPSPHSHGHGKGHDKNKAENGDGSATPSATPSPNLDGLCQAYSSGVADAHGKALDNPAFTALATAAGGADKVAAYCEARLAANPHGRPTDLPTQATKHKPASHPTGRPESVPPVTHP